MKTQTYLLAENPPNMKVLVSVVFNPEGRCANVTYGQS